MHTREKSTRTVSITTKVSSEEEAKLKAAAEARGVTLSEYAREVLLREQPDNRALLAEIIASRKIVGGLLLELINGAFQTSDAQARAQAIKQVIDSAEATKWASTEKRILEAEAFKKEKAAKAAAD